ncbi:hypothetical protein M419DRAFT_5802 [Trichoderma reesei RUT C-30]|uniref:Uncharacterized protein n=1 Tax=Hypocrea jecorina (strain ATCC 56765 / BCRC 32924 / NRRL 11460 / Rut C-30) TaxID=1344414 RepID=A0A024SLH2_HYPJR|nr:hypothetical protein M419DRAFT_5802 [Trichoderma reesei RUT C-30]
MEQPMSMQAIAATASSNRHKPERETSILSRQLWGLDGLSNLAGFRPGSGMASLEWPTGNGDYDRDENENAVEDAVVDGSCSDKTWGTWGLSHGRDPLRVVASSTRYSGGGSSSSNISSKNNSSRRLGQADYVAQCK